MYVCCVDVSSTVGGISALALNMRHLLSTRNFATNISIIIAIWNERHYHIHFTVDGLYDRICLTMRSIALKQIEISYPDRFDSRVNFELGVTGKVSGFLIVRIKSCFTITLGWMVYYIRGPVSLGGRHRSRSCTNESCRYWV